MYNFHLQIKPSIKDTCARLGGPLYLELGFGITMTVQKHSFMNRVCNHWTGLLDWTSAWTLISMHQKHFYALYLPVELHNPLEQPPRIAILLQRGTYLRSTISDVASTVRAQQLAHASVADKDRQTQTK